MKFLIITIDWDDYEIDYDIIDINLTKVNVVSIKEVWISKKVREKLKEVESNSEFELRVEETRDLILHYSQRWNESVVRIFMIEGSLEEVPFINVKQGSHATFEENLDTLIRICLYS